VGKKNLIIGFLFIMLIITAVYSYFFLAGVRRKQPNRAKLVIVSEVLSNAETGDLCTGPGDGNWR